MRRTHECMCDMYICRERYFASLVCDIVGSGRCELRYEFVFITNALHSKEAHRYARNLPARIIRQLDRAKYIRCELHDAVSGKDY